MVETDETGASEMGADLRREVERAINMYSAERGSNTPDFILAEYLISCLEAFDVAVCARGKWWGQPVHTEKEPDHG